MAVASMTDSDRAKVAELRELVKEHLTSYYDTDFNLLRWLKGHDYNLDIIKPKLINHLLFRKSDWDLDHLADKPRNHAVHAHWKSGLTGQAGQTPNVIVNIEQTGGNDYWGMLSSYPINEILRARVHDLESMLRGVMELEKKTGEQASVMYIMDLSGLKMDRKLTTLLSGGLASISAFMQEHYVEMIHSFVLVNVPSFISAIWTLARPLLPERTKNKVNILGSNWKEEVLGIADAHCLPSYWNEDGVEIFTAPVERGVPFPVEGYYKGTPSTECTTTTVTAGKTAAYDIEANEGQTLHWEIHADGHFAFAVYCLSSKAEEEKETDRVYPLFSKIPGPTLVPCDDKLIAPRTGVYRFWFGNQHAWFHTLKVKHLIKAE